jgi:CDP-diacylglycerol---serine O-phosphatidyltransferase
LKSELKQKTEPLPLKEQLLQKRGIYLLPNLFTTISLFSAFYAIVAAMKMHFETAVIAVFIGMIADTLDGRVARMTNTQTAFGAEYDSLADMVTSGVAPALIAYSWSLGHLGKIGWLIAFIYTATVALRLARFNTQLGVANKKYFQGLPCPSAAGVVISFVWTSSHYHIASTTFDVFFACVILLVSFCMVSNFRYNSFKDLELKKAVSFVCILAVVLLLAAIAMNPALMLLFIFCGYALSGPMSTLILRRKMKQETKKQDSKAQDKV